MTRNLLKFRFIITGILALPSLAIVLQREGAQEKTIPGTGSRASESSDQISFGSDTRQKPEVDIGVSSQSFPHSFGSRKLGVNPDHISFYVSQVFSENKEENRNYCQQNDLNLAATLEGGYDPEQHDGWTKDDCAYIQMLCNQKKAGFEMEFKMFPAKFNREDLEQGRTVMSGNVEHYIGLTINDESPAKLGFRDSEFYGLGWDDVQPYYPDEDWAVLKKDFPDINDEVNAFNLEFRTYGGLDKGRLNDSQNAIMEFVNEIQANLARVGAWQFKQLNLNSIWYFLHRETMVVTPKNCEKSIEFQPQLTLSFNIRTFLREVEHLIGKSFMQDSPLQPNILRLIKSSDVYVDVDTSNMKLNQQYLHSGMKYFEGIRRDLFLNQDIPDPHGFWKSQRDYLVFIACHWFLDVRRFKFQPSEESMLLSVPESYNKGLGNNYMKGYSFLLPRKNERINIEPPTIEKLLRVVPFYDIYLPYEVCAKSEVGRTPLSERLDKLEELKSTFDYTLVEGIKKLEHYIHYVKDSVDAGRCFLYSFSLYLVDIFFMNLEAKSLVINWYYELNISKEDRRPFPSNTITDLEPSTVIVENRAMKNVKLSSGEQMGPLFTEFINDFFD